MEWRREKKEANFLRTPDEVKDVQLLITLQNLLMGVLQFQSASTNAPIEFYDQCWMPKIHFSMSGIYSIFQEIIVYT